MSSANANFATQLPAGPSREKEAPATAKTHVLPPTVVEQIMTEEVVTASPDYKFEELARLMFRQPLHHLPVVDNDGRLAGIVSDRDLLLLMAQKKSLQGVTVGELMSHAVVTVQPRTSLSDAAGKMLARRVHCLPVVDGGGKLCGIVTSTDLMKAFQRLQACVERATATGDGSQS